MQHCNWKISGSWARKEERMTSLHQNVTLELLTGSMVVTVEDRRGGVDSATTTTVPYEVIVALLKRAGYTVEKRQCKAESE